MGKSLLPRLDETIADKILPEDTASYNRALLIYESMDSMRLSFLCRSLITPSRMYPSTGMIMTSSCQVSTAPSTATEALAVRYLQGFGSG